MPKKPKQERAQVNFRTKPERIERWKRAAEKERRSLSNFIEVATDERADVALSESRKKEKP